MTNLQQLEKRIRELVPSTVELSFGCELEARDYKMKYIGKNNNQHAILVKNQAMMFVDRLGDTTKILGHPIQLHHVLQAIEKTEHAEDIQVQFWGGKWHISYFDGENNSGCEWDPTQPLSGQSDETVNFLLEILK